MHAGAERPDPSGLSFGRHTCFLLTPPASILGSSSVEPFSFGFSSSQVGTTVLLARCTRVPVLPDQPTFGQLVPFPWVINDLIYF
jgi:hypothetical protein